MGLRLRGTPTIGRSKRVTLSPTMGNRQPRVHLRFGLLEVALSEQLVIQGHKLAAADTRRGNNDLVRWILMERSWQLRGLDGNARCKLEQHDTRICQGRIEPIINRAWELEPIVLDELRDLLAGAHTDSQPFADAFRENAKTCWRAERSVTSRWSGLPHRASRI